MDGYGTASLSTDYLARLTAAGVRVHLFDPRPRLLGMRTNLFRRLHRKLVVIDRQPGFVGAQGRPARSFPARWPVLPLDRIYLRNARGRQPRILSRRPWSHLSDHLPLAVEVEP